MVCVLDIAAEPRRLCRMRGSIVPDSLLLPSESEVHVWSLWIPDVRGQIRDISRSLSEEERARGARFVREEDRERFGLSHGLLRELLGAYLGVDGATLPFQANAWGKPALVPRERWPALRFNMAHSGEAILYGVGIGREIGVDVEKIKDDFDFLELARSQFSPEEWLELSGMGGGVAAREAFFRCWTRKEAYLKARGEGLAEGLGHFSVALRPGQKPMIFRSAGEEPLDWTMSDLEVFHGYASALVAAGRDLQVKHQKLTA